MSIATDEAFRRWPEIDASAGGVILQSYAERYAARRSGFVEGAEWQSQREPTYAEINAAAKALCERWHPGEWDTGFETADDDCRRDAEAMLLAARKAVTE